MTLLVVAGKQPDKTDLTDSHPESVESEKSGCLGDRAVSVILAHQTAK